MRSVNAAKASPHVKFYNLSTAGIVFNFFLRFEQKSGICFCCSYKKKSLSHGNNDVAINNSRNRKRKSTNFFVFLIVFLHTLLFHMICRCDQGRREGG